MKRCKSIRKLMAEAVLEELPEDRKRLLEAHCHECQACRAEYEDLKETLNFMGRRHRENPAPVFWTGYWDRLTDRWNRSVNRPGFETGRKRLWISWAWKGAAVMGLLIIGISVGRYSARVEDRSMHLSSPVEMVSMETRTRHYIQKSKVLLMGFVNLEPGPVNEEPPDWSYQQNVSRQLIHEASDLKTAWQGAENRKLIDLIEDLEMILLQIANLESTYDAAGIELIKTGVDRKSLLLKINLEEMQHEHPPMETHLKKQKQKKI